MAKQSKPHLSREAKIKAQENNIRHLRGKRTAEKADSVEQYVYRFEGHPGDKAAEQLCKTIGCCRFIWNRMKADRDAAYQKDKTVLHPTPALYKKDEEMEWLREVDSLALCNVQLNQEAAYRAFYKGIAEFPNFKKKGKCKDSYTTNAVGHNLRLENNLLTLPKVPEAIPLNVHRKIKPDGVLKNCTITHEPNGKWMFALVYEYPKSAPIEFQGDVSTMRHIGLDMSLPKLFVDSNGNSPEFVHPYRQSEAKLAKEQRKLSKMTKDSANYNKQRQKIAKLYSKTKNQRNDFLHKLSCQMVSDYQVIGIETLDMAAIKRSLKFGKAASDIGWSEFTRMLDYKAKRTGCQIVKVDKWFPSSKICSKCGCVHKELKLADRAYICPRCGHTMDRDYQAAINIDNEAMRIVQEGAKTA